MTDLDLSNPFHFASASDVVDVIADAYVNGANLGFDGGRRQCFYLTPDVYGDGDIEQRPTTTSDDPVSSCAVGMLLRNGGIDAETLWDDGIRNENPACRVVSQYDIRIADWDQKRVGNFVQLCQTLHDQFAGSPNTNLLPPKALGFMFKLMCPQLELATKTSDSQLDESAVRRTIADAFNHA